MITSPGRAHRLTRVRTTTITEARRRFGRLLVWTARGETVVITRYGVCCAVLLPVARYRALTTANVQPVRMKRPARGRGNVG
jgi:prevent-host-death family protein